MEISHLTTEQRNESSAKIDTLSSLQIVQLMNDEDRKCADAVAAVADKVAQGIEVISTKMRAGGRLFYIGAGTSGRLGVLDASECPPTFNTRPEQVVGLIAGGPTALTTAVEGAEDSLEQAVTDLKGHRFSEADVLVGIAASGRTPYVIGGLDYARKIGATAIGLACNTPSELEDHADFTIAPVVGPEVISGSTRLKSGTVTKMVLNMLTTGTMVKLGKTYGNWMVDLRATNSKLKARSIRMVSTLTGADSRQASDTLDRCQGEVKVAVVMIVKNVSADQARKLLQDSQGRLREAISGE